MPSRLAAIVAVAFLAVASRAPADPVRCERTIAKESSKHVQAVTKALERCEDRKAAGSLAASTDCATEPVTSALVQKADTRLRQLVARRCGGADATCGTADDDALAAIGWDVGSCPDVESTGCNAAIASCTDVATCLVCVGRAVAARSIALSYAMLQQSEFGTGSAVNRCQRAIGRETARFLASRSKALAKCWDARLKGQHANPCPTPGDGKAAAAIAKAELRKRSRICAACGGGDGACGGSDDLSRDAIGFVASCPAVTPVGATSCDHAVTAAGDVVDCVDCVAEFEVDCADRLAVPTLATYPGECNPTTTTTTTTTTSTTLASCPPPPLVPLGSMTFTIGAGTADCGGQGLEPGPAAPFSGEVDALDGSKRSDLGLGCLYVGDATNLSIPGARVPDGGRSVLAVAGVSGLAITVTASDGSGPADCTKGAGPARHCLNGKPGSDSMGACASDADCAGGGSIGACQPDANCYFGSPLPVPLGGLSVCIMNAVAHDVCGSANLLTNTTDVSAALSSRVYLTSNPDSPCPQCISGTCSAGERAGLPCSPVGSAATTIDCPPKKSQFFGTLDVNLASLNTGTSTLTDPAGNLCPGQLNPGAFGGEARSVVEHGAPLLGSLGNPFATTLAGTFCVPATGNPFFDTTSGLPGPGAVSVPGTVTINLLP